MKVACTNCGSTNDVAKFGDVWACAECVAQLDDVRDGWEYGTCPACGLSTQCHSGERRAVHELPVCQWYTLHFLTGSGVPPYAGKR